MFECIKIFGRLGLVSKLFALLLTLTMLYSISVSAQEAGGDNVLSGMSGMTGMSLGGGMSTDISNIADICANALDKAACAKKLAATQTRTLQATPDTNLPSQRQSTNPKTPRPPQTNEFQEFITASVGKKLPLFGYNLFEGSPDTFAPVDNIPVTPDYLVGPGDEIVITAWGQVDINIHATVNRNGSIDLPKVGNVNVAGVRYQDLQGHLKNAIGHVYRNFDLSVSLGKLRSIQVFVVGQAMQPGVYTVSSLSTLVNTLFASGGPSVNGSMRHIQVKRNGAVVTELDLYDLLLKGDKTKDLPLLPGDVIYIPPAKQYVAISGGINNPAIYELKDDNTALSDLIELAGGVTSTSDGKKVLVERIVEHKVRKVEEFKLDMEGLTKIIHDGDMVVVESISMRFDNAVKLQGNVAEPSRYVWKEGMRISDLLKDANSLIPKSYWERQNSGIFDVSFNKKEVNWDYAVVQRLDQDNLATKLFAFNLGKAIKGDPVENILLKPGDVITIYSAEDVLPKTENDVVLKGSIFSPSVWRFVWRDGMRVNDMIPNTKWLIDHYDYWANINGSKNLKCEEVIQQEKVTQDKRNDLSEKGFSNNKLQGDNKLQGELNLKDTKNKLEKQALDCGKPNRTLSINWGYANIIRLQPDDLTRVMLTFDLGKAILKNDSANNLALLPGDEVTIFTNSEISVPIASKNKFVRIDGEVNHAGEYQLLPGETLRQLVVRVGGLTPNAYLFGTELDRESVRTLQQEKLKEMIDRMETAVNQATSNKVQGVLSAEDAAIAKSQEASQAALIARLRKVQATGRLVLEIPPESSQIKDLPDLALENGDHLSVPARSDVVSVVGMVYNQSSFMYRSGKSIRDYLDQAGGPTRDADEARMYLLRADGSLVSAQKSSSLLSFNSFSNGTIEPGDAIVVPEMLDKFVLSKELKDWTQVFYQFAMGAAGLKVLGL